MPVEVIKMVVKITILELWGNEILIKKVKSTLSQFSWNRNETWDNNLHLHVLQQNFTTNNNNNNNFNSIIQGPDETTGNASAAQQLTTTITTAATSGRRKSNWCFLDSVTALRFFRIDRAQVNLDILR